MLMDNPLLDTDSYKLSHWKQYPPDTQAIFNYLESRGGAHAETPFFGLQYLLMRYFSQRILPMHVREAADFYKKHGVDFNEEGWMGVAKEKNGQLPLLIKAVPEGTVVPTGYPLMSCVSTDPRYFWVVGYFETQKMRLWYPTTVGTNSREVKKVIKKFMVETCDTLDKLPFMLHDFGSRGATSRESAAIGGGAHLQNFFGTDTTIALAMLADYYDADMAGFSINAAEHSTITSWGKENEAAAYANMLKQFAKPGSILAVVSDSYDIYNAVENIWGGQLKQQVIDSGATVVIRPDSGDPVFTVAKLLTLLDQKFGSKLNSKGFKVLNHVRLIQGDGLTPYTIECILKSTKLGGFSVDNLAFGMGGGLLQQVNRDTQKFAYKASAIERDPLQMPGMSYLTRGPNPQKTVWMDVFKSPVDAPEKKSKAGRIGTKKTTKGFEVCQDNDPENLLTPVFADGEILRYTNFKNVRELAEVP